MELKNKRMDLFLLVVLSALTLLIFSNILFFIFYFEKDQKGGKVDEGGAFQNNSVTEQKIEDASQKNSNYYNIEIQDENSEIGQVIKKVSNHIILPGGKTTVATVMDPETLRKENPAFYQYVKRGDKLIYYANGVILYDPVLDRILDVFRVFATSTKQ